MLNLISSADGRLARCLVVVPVKDEADRVAPCLRAIAGQHTEQADGILLLVNNTTDATLAVVHAVGATLAVPVLAIEHHFAPGKACAGAARRMGMEHAAAMLDEAGVLLTTDADGCVPADWIAANLWHLRAGAEAVAGRAVLDAADAAAIPRALHEADAQECAYAAVLDAIAGLLDPEPWDPAPRHTEHSGASIAVSRAAYQRAGGMPAATLAEDRQFFAALRRVDARIRHAPEIEVVVSGRTVGRAEGGMADTIRRRLTHLDPYLDGALEPAAMLARRAWLRHCFGRAWSSAVDRPALVPLLSAALALPAELIGDALAGRYRGESWASLEAHTTMLPRQHVSVALLADEMKQAERLHDALSSAVTVPDYDPVTLAALLDSQEPVAATLER